MSSGMRNVEKIIWQEAKKIFQNKKLRLKDILEWSTSEKQIRENLLDGEVMAQVLEFWAAVEKIHDKRTAKEA